MTSWSLVMKDLGLPFDLEDTLFFLLSVLAYRRAGSVLTCFLFFYLCVLQHQHGASLYYHRRKPIAPFFVILLYLGGLGVSIDGEA